MSKSFHPEIQRRLDFLDEYIDSLEREKREAGDTDISVVEEAKGIHRMAREHYSRAEYREAWSGITWAEACILGVGRYELESYKSLSRKVDQILGLKTP